MILLQIGVLIRNIYISYIRKEDLIMDLLNIYNELNDLYYFILDHTKSDELEEIKESILKIRDEVKDQIKDTWL